MSLGVKVSVAWQVMIKKQGGNSQNFLEKSWDYLGLKYFLKQISYKGDVNYYINHKILFFYE